MTMTARLRQSAFSRRRLLVPLVGASMVAVALAGCQVSELAHEGAATAPLPASLERKIAAKGMNVRSPIMLRIYKEDNKLEVWKEDRTGKFVMLTDYDICAWSGKLGPKKKEGDRQAPEGFYTVTPGQMNPNSSYHLSFNLGFPNAYDRSLGRTGSHLMVHGDCSSRGCYAMEDEPIQEIYALAREAFRGGQQGFQVQALPFRMTPENMAKHADDENLAFWEMLKEGTDHFEVTQRVPRVDVCGKKYVFNAKPVSGSFSASADCPAYDVPDDVELLVAAKTEADTAKQRKEVARILAQQEREERWEEREKTVASFFAAGTRGDADEPATATGLTSTSVAAETGEAASTLSTAAAVSPGSVPVPRPSPSGNARSNAAVASNSQGGFRIPNPFARRAPEAPVASVSGVADADEAATSAADTDTAAPAPAPASTPVEVASQNEPANVGQAGTGTEPLGYAPADSDDGFLSGVAKTTGGFFRRAGSLFNN